MGALVRRWRGDTWQALLTREPYGLHFSVSGQGREPNSAEVDEAMHGYPALRELVEITAAHRAIGTLNPFVRHFVPTHQARRYFELAARR